MGFSYDKQQESNIFFSKWASSYDLLSPFFEWFHRRIMRRLNLNAHLKLLDIACGTGVLLSKLSAHNFELHGIDINKRMLAVAEKKLGSRAVLVEGDVHSLPYDSNSFDIVVCTEAFHHFPNPAKALSEMSRVLRTDGRLIIFDISFMQRIINKYLYWVEPGFVKFFNKSEFRALFEAAGIHIVNQKVFSIGILTDGIKAKV